MERSRTYRIKFEILKKIYKYRGERYHLKMFHSGMMIKLLVVSVQNIKTEQNKIINVTPSNMSFILSLVITILKKDAMIK